MTRTNRKIRVAQIGPVPPPHGGVSTNMMAVHEELLVQGHESWLIDVTQRNGVGSGPRVIKPRSAAGLAIELIRGRFDVVHYHIGGDFTLKLAALAMFCGGLPRSRSVVTFHSGGFAERATDSAKLFSIRGLAFKLQDAVVGVNERMLEMFHSFGVSSQRTHLIPPFDFKPPDPNVPIPEGIENFIADAAPLLISVGALEPEYRNEMLVRAMPAIVKSLPGTRLLIVGSGTLENELEAAVSGRGLDRSILLTGNLDRNVVLRLIERSSVLFRITDYDGDSVAVREALFLGTPVIASDNVIRPEGCALVRTDVIPEHLAEMVFKIIGSQSPGHSHGPPGPTNARSVVELYESILNK